MERGVALFMVLSQHLLGRAKEKHRKSQPGWPVEDFMNMKYEC
jgi:hypothetical protein